MLVLLHLTRSLAPLLAIAPADAHALTMVGILAFALGILLTLFYCIYRESKRNQELNLPDLEDFLAEDKPSRPTKPSSTHSKPPPEDWERDADWWKK